MSEQLSFDLPVREARGRADFYVAPSNALALQLIERSEGWPEGKLILTGPAASGKTHLAHVWSALTGARILAADAIEPAAVPTLAAGPLAVEDVPRLAGNTTGQETLFHLHNLMRANRAPLLMTGRGRVRDWPLALPDLHSRLAGAQGARLEPPCDALLAAVLAKLFDDRQLRPRPDLIPYLLNRIDRSFEAAARVVARLDALSLSEGRMISRQLAVRLLDGDGADP